MRKVVSILVLFIALNSIAQEKAKVQKVNGIEVYLLSEPVRKYEILNTAGKGIQWGSAFTGGIVNESIATRVSKYIIKLGEGYKDGDVKFDAIVYTNGKQMTAIKFTDKKTSKNDRISVVQEIEGIPFFVMSKPLKKYDFVSTIGGGIKWKSLVTGGLANNSIEKDLMRFAKKMKKKFRKKEISAIIYERGKKASAIKFTE